MDKAARAVRRSSIKLLALGGGHTDLHVLLSEVKDMRNTAKAFMNAQNTVSQDFLKWAMNEENRALQDVANQLAELNLLWTEVQREFGEHMKEYRHMFEMILEGEKHVAQSKNNFSACEQREVKARKELKKAYKKSSNSEIQGLEGRLMQAERAKDLAQLEVMDRIRENEAVKLIRLKEGLLRLSQAYSDFARKCSVVFDAQQDIVQQLPDVLDHDLEDMKYTGSGATRYRVQQAKEKVRSYRRGRDRSLQIFNEAPPPYSASQDYSDDTKYKLEKTPKLYPSLNESPRRRITIDAQLREEEQIIESPIVEEPQASSTPDSSCLVAPNLPPELPADMISIPSASMRERRQSAPEMMLLTQREAAEILDLANFGDRSGLENSYEEDLSGAMGGAKI